MDLKLNTTRPKFMVKQPGSDAESAWEYDVLTLKLEFERLEEAHGFSKKTNTPEAVSSEFLTDCATMLNGHGLYGCNSDAAYRVYQIVSAQFVRLAADLEKQIASALEA